MRFDGKRVLVTGASRGIGRAIAVAFAAGGARVAVHYNGSEGPARETISLLAGDGHLLVQADISDPAEVERMVTSATHQLQGLDILVNNAGIYMGHPLLESSFEEWQDGWRQTVNVNLVGAANATYWAARQMAANGGGRVVCISSRGAFRGEPDHPAYAASKAGLNAMAQSLAQSLAPYSIFVGVVAPGFVETDMAAEFLDGPGGEAIRNQSPTGRVARPEEVAHAVLFLASSGAEFTTGSVIDVNGASYLRT
ncbi:MAG: SDR family NAD(P)-dependent oxidoreductase [Candidatus Dormibacteria bacterium]